MDVSKELSLIKSLRHGEVAPRVGIILGTGLNSISNFLKNKLSISYEELSTFPQIGVDGHDGYLILGEYSDLEIVILQGRAHYYETGKVDLMKNPIQVLSELGCEFLIITNSAGSLIDDFKPGKLVLINDHINFTGVSPLFGTPGNERFVDMVNAYDPKIRKIFRTVAIENNIPLAEGVYSWFSGPNFETPSEIRAAKLLGGHVVGMSTVPEVILSRFFGLKVAAISIITNMGAGLSEGQLSHEKTIKNANAASESLNVLLTQFLKKIKDK
tara:strand:+ start:12578 stop:13390 length:813 start_codon:yes stop_codon:yes gene_type:complete